MLVLVNNTEEEEEEGVERLKRGMGREERERKVLREVTVVYVAVLSV